MPKRSWHIISKNDLIFNHPTSKIIGIHDVELLLASCFTPWLQRRKTSQTLELQVNLVSDQPLKNTYRLPHLDHHGIDAGAPLSDCYTFSCNGILARPEPGFSTARGCRWSNTNGPGNHGGDHYDGSSWNEEGRLLWMTLIIYKYNETRRNKNNEQKCSQLIFFVGRSKWCIVILI